MSSSFRKAKLRHDSRKFRGDELQEIHDVIRIAGESFAQFRVLRRDGDRGINHALIQPATTRGACRFSADRARGRCRRA